MSDAETRFEHKFRRGVHEFNGGRYFEAHALWEELWADEVDSRKRFLQGLIQAAAGFHKAEIGVPGGARKLWKMSLRILHEFPDRALGIDVGEFRGQIEEALAGRASSSARLSMVESP